MLAKEFCPLAMRIQPSELGWTVLIQEDWYQARESIRTKEKETMLSPGMVKPTQKREKIVVGKTIDQQSNLKVLVPKSAGKWQWCGEGEQ